MKVYCVIAHPEPHQRSFCHAVYNKAISTLKLNGHEVISTDLFKAGFASLPGLGDFEDPNPELTMADNAKITNPTEEILRFRSRIEWCTHLLLFTPLQWLGPSAALMAWWERVFTEGWAYDDASRFNSGFMEGKKAMVVVTAGMDKALYGKTSLNVCVEELMYPLTFRCFARCGFTPLRTMTFFGVQTIDAQKRVDLLNSWGEHVAALEERETINFNTPESNQPVGGIVEHDEQTNHKILAELGDMEDIIEKDPYAYA